MLRPYEPSEKPRNKVIANKVKQSLSENEIVSSPAAPRNDIPHLFFTHPH
jgi:hypothetical protein